MGLSSVIQDGRRRYVEQRISFCPLRKVATSKYLYPSGVSRSPDNKSTATISIGAPVKTLFKLPLGLVGGPFLWAQFVHCWRHLTVSLRMPGEWKFSLSLNRVFSKLKCADIGPALACWNNLKRKNLVLLNAMNCHRHSLEPEFLVLKNICGLCDQRFLVSNAVAYSSSMNGSWSFNKNSTTGPIAI